LTSLDEESVGAEDPTDDARDGGKVVPVDTQAGSSQEPDSRLGAPDGQQVETAAQERYKLWTSLIAKVLMEKCKYLFLRQKAKRSIPH
jgi:hypothetical protein